MDPLNKKYKDCRADFDGVNLTIGNSAFQRRWTLTQFGPATVSIEAGDLKIVRNIGEDTPCDFQYEGLTGRKIGPKMEQVPLVLKDLRMKSVRAPKIGPARLETTLTFASDHQGLVILWHVWIMPGVPAITVFGELKSENSPLGVYNRTDFQNIVDSTMLPEGMERVESVLFRARTDRTNELAESRLMAPGVFAEEGAVGNLLLVNGEGKGLFVVHDGPCRDDRRLETDRDFQQQGSTVSALGWGIRPEEVSHREFLKSCSVTIGAFEGDLDQGHLALKRFLRARYPYLGRSRPVLLANPWGDRQWYEHCHREFVEKEVEACAEIGFTDYQLDDGWQAGGNLHTISANGLISDEYWRVDDKRFPGGFEQLCSLSDKHGVQLGLWYAGDSNRNYRLWKEDVDRVLRLQKAGSFERIKIDMTRTRTKSAERNFLKILQAIRITEPDSIVFDLDLTGAIQRPGYFMLLDYSDIFVENRYTAWHNYWPWKAARNFWMLSRYLPIQRLELEYLNPKLNADKYESEDLLAPSRYSIDYLFATTFFSIPLFWGEPSALEREERELLKPLLQLRKDLHQEIRERLVVPIGSEPDGKSWFGFLAIDEREGKHLMTLFRDQLAPETCEICLPTSVGKPASIQRLAGTIQVDAFEAALRVSSTLAGAFGIFDISE